MRQNEFTIDSIWADDVRIMQPKRGYRFAIDAVLLAHFLKTKPGDEILEVGTGSGVIPVLLSKLKRFRRLTAVEIQEALAEIAVKNIDMNGIKNVEVLRTDVRKIKNASFDLLFSNPPYRKSGSGKLNPDQQKAIARHEISMRLEDLFDCAIRVLKPEGRFSVILPAFRERDFIHLADQHSLHWMERRYIHSFRKDAPAFFLATLCRTASRFEEQEPLTIYETPGHYTAQMESLLNCAPANPVIK